MQNSLIDVLSREVGSTYNKNKDRSFSRTETEKTRNFNERMRDKDFKNKQKLLETDFKKQQKILDADFARKLIEANRRDSVRDAKDVRKFEQLLKQQKADSEANFKLYDQRYNQRTKTDSINWENRLAKEKSDRKEIIEAEKAKLRSMWMAPNLRGKFADFFDEEGGLMNLGLNESDLITGYNQGQTELNQAVSNIKSMGIPKSSPQRQKIENLALDMWKHINGDDMGADFLDGGGFLGALGLENKQATQAQGIYDELESILMQLGIPEEEWQNRLWVK